jgi:hypothetical protein
MASSRAGRFVKRAGEYVAFVPAPPQYGAMPPA